MDRAEVTRWLASRRAAAERERQEAREAGVEAEEAITAGLALIRLGGELHGWPVPEDPVTRREDEQLYATWVRLREGWRER